MSSELLQDEMKDKTDNHNENDIDSKNELTSEEVDVSKNDVNSQNLVNQSEKEDKEGDVNEKEEKQNEDKEEGKDEENGVQDKEVEVDQQGEGDIKEMNEGSKNESGLEQNENEVGSKEDDKNMEENNSSGNAEKIEEDDDKQIEHQNKDINEEQSTIIKTEEQIPSEESEKQNIKEQEIPLSEIEQQDNKEEKNITIEEQKPSDEPEEQNEKEESPLIETEIKSLNEKEEQNNKEQTSVSPSEQILTTPTTEQASIPPSEQTIPKEVNPQNIKEQKIQQFKQIKQNLHNLFLKFQSTLSSSLDQHNKQINAHRSFLNTLYTYNKNREEIILRSDRKDNTNLEWHKNRRATAEEELIKSVSTASKTQETINDQIETVFSLFTNFLTEPQETLNKRNPIKFFIDKNKTALTKIGFKNFNQTLIKDFVPNLANKKILSIHSINEIDDEFLKKVYENKELYQKISFKHIKYDHCIKVFQNIKQLPKVKHLKLKRCDLNNKNENDSLMKFNFNDLLPNIFKLKINTCPYITLSTIKLDSLSKIQKLHLTNLNLTSTSSTQIIYSLSRNKNTLDNLTELSFAHNKITRFSLIREHSVPLPFTALKELNLEDNKLYRFGTENFNLTPHIRVINLMNNNFAFDETFNGLIKASKVLERENSKENKGVLKKILILTTKNLFMLKEEQRENYIKYLSGIIDKFDYNLKYLSFESLFHLNNKSLLSSINIGSLFQERLCYINLSLCSLGNNDVVSFFEKNNNLVNLRTLNLSFNNLDDLFFDLFVAKNLHKQLSSLSKIYLSGNEKIFCREKKKLLVNFIQNNEQLKNIVMIRTGFDKLFITKFLKIKKIEEQQQSKKEEDEKVLADIQDLVQRLAKVERNVKLVFNNLFSVKTMESLRGLPEMKFFEFLDVKINK